MTNNVNDNQEEEDIVVDVDEVLEDQEQDHPNAETPEDKSTEPEDKMTDGSDKEEVEAAEEKHEKTIFDDEQQAQVDSIISRMKNSHKLEIHGLNDRLAQQQENAIKLQEYIDRETERNKQLNQKLNDDGLIDDDLKPLATQNEMPQFQQQQAQYVALPGAKMFDQQLPVNQDAMELANLRNKFIEKYPNDINSIIPALDHLVTNRKMPRDVLNLAARDESGVEFIKQLVSDEDLANAVILAGYDSKDINEFTLKFKEIRDKIKLKSSFVPKAKPEPNTPIRSAPSQKASLDENTIYI